ncbi:MAG: glycosyltransferase [Phormidesmis sp.]
MKILFLDQSSQLGGAELCLLDLAQYYRKSCLVCTFSAGPFPQRLIQENIAVEVLAQKSLQFQKQSGIAQAAKSLGQLWPLIWQVSRLSAQYDCIYANTQKALVVGAIASLLSRKPLVYHLHDILSAEHFSALSRRIIVTCANQAVLVIANSQASRSAFVSAGGRAARVQVVYNGFDLDAAPRRAKRSRSQIRSNLGFTDQFVVGHFSRLSSWKGQHVLLDALKLCPPQVCAVLVGDALFGEKDYAMQLQQQVKDLELDNRVKFLGFRSDIPELMSACDLITHTSTVSEPFGRVIVEGMLSDRPVVAAAAGGALEIIEPGQTGWLSSPGDSAKLAEIITLVYRNPELASAIAKQAQAVAKERFNLSVINAQIDDLLKVSISHQPPSSLHHNNNGSACEDESRRQ